MICMCIYIHTYAFYEFIYMHLYICMAKSIIFEYIHSYHYRRCFDEYQHRAGCRHTRGIVLLIYWFIFMLTGCMYVYVYIYIYIYVYMYIYNYMYIYIYMYAYIKKAEVYSYWFAIMLTVYMCLYTYSYMYIYVYIYV
jgi:hypothetical protein